MTRLILIFSTTFLNAVLFAQAPAIQWTKTFGGDSSDAGYSIQQTDDGGFIVIGKTRSFGAGNSDVWLIRTDSSGDTLWTQTYGGVATDAGSSVRQISDGGHIIAGTTWSFGAGASDVWLIRTDSYGDTLWTQTFGRGSGLPFSGRESGSSAEMTSDGGYIIAGNWGTGNSYFVGNIVLIKTNTNGDSLWMRHFGGNGSRGLSAQQTSDGGYIIAGHNWYNAILIKTDANGDTLWTKMFEGISEVYSNRSVHQTSDGGYVLCRNTLSSDNYDVNLIKTDANGDTLWTKTFGDSGQDYCYSVQQTTDEGYVLCGYTNSYGSGDFDAWIIKTDANGDTLWTKNLGGSGADFGFSMQQTSDGGYVLCGYTNSYGAGDANVWLIKLAPDVTTIEENSHVSINDYQLKQNYPNPFNPTTTINYQLAVNSKVELTIYNLLGQQIRTMVNTHQLAGAYQVQWNGRNESGMSVTSGIYFYQLNAGKDYSETKKMVLMR